MQVKITLDYGIRKTKMTTFWENGRKKYYQEESHIYGKINVEDAINKALLTWSHWVETHIDPNKTIMFF